MKAPRMVGVPSACLCPLPLQSDFIFGSEGAATLQGGKAHYSNNIFGSPYPQEDADKKMEKTRVSRALYLGTSSGIAAAGAARLAVLMGPTPWPKPSPAGNAVAERAAAAVTCCNRIFGVEEQGADVLAPSPLPAAGGALATAAAMAARQTPGPGRSCGPLHAVQTGGRHRGYGAADERQTLPSLSSPRHV